MVIPSHCEDTGERLRKYVISSVVYTSNFFLYLEFCLGQISSFDAAKSLGQYLTRMFRFIEGTIIYPNNTSNCERNWAKYLGQILSRGYLLHRGTIFGLDKITNCERNWTPLQLPNLGT